MSKNDRTHLDEAQIKASSVDGGPICPNAFLPLRQTQFTASVSPFTQEENPLAAKCWRQEPKRTSESALHLKGPAGVAMPEQHVKSLTARHHL